MTNNVLVSIIVPCRNEEKFISKCLDSIILQDFPKDKLEVLVVDGMSEDGTREILKKYQREHPFIKVLDNVKKITPSALNIGIENSKGEIIIRMDSHADYQKDYISKCVRYLKEYNADNVGGIIRTLPAKDNIIAKAIAISLSHFFGAGGSYFRTGAEKPKWVDTVFGGCYKKEVFKRVGLFNENLVRSQDMEFNLRLKKAGGKILLASDIISCYYPKSSIKDFFVHNIKDGIWAVYPLKFVRLPLRLRHYIPLIFVLSLLGTGLLAIFFSVFFWLFISIICFYLLAAVYFSVKTAVKEKKIGLFVVLPIVFAARHIGYGLGSIWGLMKLFSFLAS